MHGCFFSLTIAWLLVDRTSLARPEASKHVQASGVVRTSTTFADLGDDVMEELARDFERELDVIADELQTVSASAENGCSSSSGSDDDDLRRALDDQELRALFEELEPAANLDGEGDAVTVAATTTATTNPSIDTAAARERGRSNASTNGNKADTSSTGTSDVGTSNADTSNASTNGDNASTSNAGTSNAGTSNVGTSSPGARGHENRRKRRPCTPRRTTQVRGSGRSRSESSSSTASKLARRRRRRRHAKRRSAAGACRLAAPRHRSRAARKSAPSSVVRPLGARGAAARAATATTSTDTGAHRSNSPNGKVGVNARSTSAAVQQQRRRQQQHQQQQQIRHGSFEGAASVAAAGTGDAPRRGSEGSPLRRLRGVLIAAAIVAALSTTVLGRRWPRPLVLVAVPLVHALVTWMANLVRSSSRDTKERILGALKVAVVLASAVGVYVLAMALTQPLSKFSGKDR